jgi:radical SAM protein with 4Fe4S-binding SPASM domain
MLTENICRGIVEAGLDRIIISLDGSDQESYQAYRRGGDIEKVKNGIRTLERVRRERGSGKPFIVVQFLVFKHNRHQIMDVKKLAGQLGADKVWIKTAQMEYPDSADEWIPEDPDLSRYAMGTSGEWAQKGKLRNRCRRLWQTTVITSDGTILPCCFDKRAVYTMGSAVGQGIAATWKNKSYQDFRKRILLNRRETAICTNCTEGIGRIFN